MVFCRRFDREGYVHFWVYMIMSEGVWRTNGHLVLREQKDSIVRVWKVNGMCSS
jgi:hypothetical protein